MIQQGYRLLRRRGEGDPLVAEIESQSLFRVDDGICLKIDAGAFIPGNQPVPEVLQQEPGICRVRRHVIRRIQHALQQELAGFADFCKMAFRVMHDILPVLLEQAVHLCVRLNLLLVSKS